MGMAPTICHCHLEFEEYGTHVHRPRFNVQWACQWADYRLEQGHSTAYRCRYMYMYTRPCTAPPKEQHSGLCSQDTLPHIPQPTTIDHGPWTTVHTSVNFLCHADGMAAPGDGMGLPLQSRRKPQTSTWHTLK